MSAVEKLRALAVNVAGAVLMAAWEVSRRIRGRWRRSALRERFNEWAVKALGKTWFP